MRNAFKLVLAMLAALLLTGTLLSATTTSAVAAEPQLKVVNANLDGNSAADAIARANTVGANIVTLQELCRTQLNNLTDGSWKSEGSFIVTRPAGCADGSDKGQAILLRKNSGTSSGGVVSQTALYNPPGSYRTFYLTCLHDIAGPLSGSKSLYVCTTHLFTNGDIVNVDGGTVRENQMNDIEAKILPWATGGSYANRKTVFTGDLNMYGGSTQLTQIKNAFEDVCQGLNTTDNGSKLDYIFADKSPALAGSNCAVVDNSTAGHKVLNGNITFPS